MIREITTAAWWKWNDVFCLTCNNKIKNMTMYVSRLLRVRHPLTTPQMLESVKDQDCTCVNKEKKRKEKKSNDAQSTLDLVLV